MCIKSANCINYKEQSDDNITNTAASVNISSYYKFISCRFLKASASIVIAFDIVFKLILPTTQEKKQNKNKKTIFFFKKKNAISAVNVCLQVEDIKSM